MSEVLLMSMIGGRLPACCRLMRISSSSLTAASIPGGAIARPEFWTWEEVEVWGCEEAGRGGVEEEEEEGRQCTEEDEVGPVGGDTG